MATRKPTDTQHENSLPGEAGMARVYRAAAQDAPPASLDARILAEAQRAVAKPKARGPFGAHWAIPLSTAAVIVLSLGVVLLLSEQGALNHRDVSVSIVAEAPLEASARSASAEPPASPAPALPTAEAPAKAKRAAPEPAAQLAASAEHQPAKSVPAETMKKAEAPPAAAVLDALKRANEADQADVAREEKVRARSTPAGVAAMKPPGADVVAVLASGVPGVYQFNVGIRSQDLGCAQYADWWEVVSTDGKLLYRRVLLHSHVDEQPFTRSGGPIPIQADTVVWVRAHMNTGGYGGAAFKGSVKTGFKQAMPEVGFAAGLAKQAPLPDGCDF
jgi:hypothetical protein